MTALWLLAYAQHWLDVALNPLVIVSRRLWGTDPPVPERNPFMVLTFGTIGVLSLLTVVGLVPAAPSLQQAPDAFTIASSACISLGSITVVGSLVAPGKEVRIIAEQLGLAFAGFGFLCYAVALIHLNGFDRAVLPAAFAGGAALGTGGVYLQLWWYLRKPWARRPRPVRITS